MTGRPVNWDTISGVWHWVDPSTASVPTEFDRNPGNDPLKGGAGYDKLSSHNGRDLLLGSLGADVARFRKNRNRQLPFLSGWAKTTASNTFGCLRGFDRRCRHPDTLTQPRRAVPLSLKTTSSRRAAVRSAAGAVGFFRKPCDNRLRPGVPVALLTREGIP